SAFGGYAALQLLYFGSWEVLFRGVLLFGLRGVMGDTSSNLVQTALSVTAHFGRSLNEACAAGPAGLVFGAIDLRLGSVWYVALLQVPASGLIYGFHVVVVDADGRLLPPEIVHHFNLIEPDHRELFLPISRRLVAAGKERGEQRLPWLLFGLPLERGLRVLAR